MILAIVLATVCVQLAIVGVMFRIVQASGHRRYWFMLAAGFALLGCVTLASMTFGDISRLSLAEEAVRLGANLLILLAFLPFSGVLEMRRDTAQAYEALLSAMRDCYYRADSNGHVEVVSASSIHMLGYTPEELKGRFVPEFYVDPDDREKFLRAMEEGGGSVEGYQALFNHRDGHTVMLEINANIITDKQGNRTGVEGVIRNITARLAREAENAQFGRIIEASRDEIYVIDAETRDFVLVNRGARENIGYSMAELRNMRSVDLRPKHNAVDLGEVVDNLLTSHRPVHRMILYVRRRDGTEYPLEANIQYSETGLRPVYVMIGQDVTERQLAEAELARAQRLSALGQLTGGVAHDFNNMMQALQLNIDKMVLSGDAQVQLRGEVNRILHMAAGLTQRLLAFSRSQTLQPKVLEVDTLLKDMQVLLKVILKEPITLSVQVDSQPMRVALDEAQLQSALVNLMINARDAMPDGGEVRIDCSIHEQLSQGQVDDLQIGRYVKLSVIDSGVGMASGILENALEPFFTTKEIGDGHGLGLSSVYGFAKQSGGHMTLESAPGAGTCVHLYFPVTEQPLVALSEPISFSRRRRSLSVLLIEDNDIVREAAMITLADLGHQVHAAQNSQEAMGLAAAHVGEFDLVLSDVLLANGAAGPETVAQVREVHGAVPVVFMSGYTRAHWGSGVEQTLDSSFLQKPFTRQQLGEAIDRLI